MNNNQHFIDEAFEFLKNVKVTDQNILVAVAYLLSALAKQLHHLLSLTETQKSSSNGTLSVSEIYDILVNASVPTRMYLLEKLELPYSDYDYLCSCFTDSSNNGKERFESTISIKQINIQKISEEIDFRKSIKSDLDVLFVNNHTITWIDGVDYFTRKSLTSSEIEMHDMYFWGSMNDGRNFFIQSIELTINIECDYIFHFLNKKWRNYEKYTQEIHLAVEDVVQKCGFTFTYNNLKCISSQDDYRVSFSIFDCTSDDRDTRILGMISIEPIKEIIKKTQGNGNISCKSKDSIINYDSWINFQYISDQVQLLHLGFSERGYQALRNDNRWKQIVEQLPLNSLRKVLSCNDIFIKYKDCFTFEEYVGISVIITSIMKPDTPPSTIFQIPEIQAYTFCIGEIILFHDWASEGIMGLPFANFNVGEPVMNLCILVYHYLCLYKEYNSIFKTSFYSEDEKKEKWQLTFEKAPDEVRSIWEDCIKEENPCLSLIKDFICITKEIKDPLLIPDIWDQSKLLFKHWAYLVEDGLIQLSIKLNSSYYSEFCNAPCAKLLSGLKYLNKYWDNDRDQIYNEVSGFQSDYYDNQLLIAIVDILLLLSKEDNHQMTMQMMSVQTFKEVEILRTIYQRLLECDPDPSDIKYPFSMYSKQLKKLRFEYNRKHKDRPKVFERDNYTPDIQSCIEISGDIQTEDSPANDDSDGMKLSDLIRKKIDGDYPTSVDIGRSEEFLSKVYDEFKYDYLAPDPSDNKDNKSSKTSKESFLHYLGCKNYNPREDAIYFHAEQATLVIFVHFLLRSIKKAPWSELARVFKHIAQKDKRWKNPAPNSIRNFSKYSNENKDLADNISKRFPKDDK